MTPDQLERWCAQTLELITGGEHDVNALIKKTGRKWGTLAAIKHLGKLGIVARYGNTVHKIVHY